MSGHTFSFLLFRVGVGGPRIGVGLAFLETVKTLSKMAVLFHAPASSVGEFLWLHVLNDTCTVRHTHFSHFVRCVIIPISWKQKLRLTHAEPFAPETTHLLMAEQRLGFHEILGLCRSQGSRHRAQDRIRMEEEVLVSVFSECEALISGSDGPSRSSSLVARCPGSTPSSPWRARAPW